MSKITPVRLILENGSEARAYIREHDKDVRIWDRMNRADRARIIRESDSGTWLIGGPETWSRDEQVNALARIAYPDHARALEIRYATAGLDHLYAGQH